MLSLTNAAASIDEITDSLRNLFAKCQRLDFVSPPPPLTDSSVERVSSVALYSVCRHHSQRLWLPTSLQFLLHLHRLRLPLYLTLDAGQSLGHHKVQYSAHLLEVNLSRTDQ